MFEVTQRDIEAVLKDYGVCSEISSVVELLRYHFGKDDVDSTEVRLILKVDLANDTALVVKFKNEKDVDFNTIESQSKFAEILEQNGIATAHMLRNADCFVTFYSLNGFDVLVTVEEFMDGEVTVVDETIAEQTGILLAKTHNISEQHNCHVECPVLFDPFAQNDLFFVETFKESEKYLSSENKVIFDRIMEAYNRHMDTLAPLKLQPRYAVQGDISACNLFLCEDGTVGLFDYNRCGDNNLFSDAVMQAIFEARLMDYPDNSGEDFEDRILDAFLRGYNQVLPFNNEQKSLFPHLYAIITAFWGMQIVHGDNCLLKICELGNQETINNLLTKIEQQICSNRQISI